MFKYSKLKNDLDNKAKIEETHELKETNEIDIKPVKEKKSRRRKSVFSKKNKVISLVENEDS
jgi:hypothetical protein